MKRQIRWSVFAALLLILSLTGCKRDLGAFEFSYSVESVDNFKVMLSMDSEKHYKVERIDYFMDNFARKRDPKVVEGVLTEPVDRRRGFLLDEGFLRLRIDSKKWHERPCLSDFSLKRR